MGELVRPGLSLYAGYVAMFSLTEYFRRAGVLREACSLAFWDAVGALGWSDKAASPFRPTVSTRAWWGRPQIVNATCQLYTITSRSAYLLLLRSSMSHDAAPLTSSLMLEMGQARFRYCLQGMLVWCLPISTEIRIFRRDEPCSRHVVGGVQLPIFLLS